jgi:hypothetical protein
MTKVNPPSKLCVIFCSRLWLHLKVKVVPNRAANTLLAVSVEMLLKGTGDLVEI